MKYSDVLKFIKHLQLYYKQYEAAFSKQEIKKMKFIDFLKEFVSEYESNIL